VHHDTTLAVPVKECPRCFRCWSDTAEICVDDGARLQAAFAGPAIVDGKYRLERRLGRGGMGVVYRAHHLGLQKPFALKVMATVGQAWFARFRAEAETLGKLKHPNIVEVTDFGVDPRGDGLPYLVMEYLEGSTLAECCGASRRLLLERGLPIFESIAKAIDHAHDRGILHLDLKPANVFVSNHEHGREAVKILDFGLARLAGEVNTAGNAGVGARVKPSERPPLDGRTDDEYAARLLRMGLNAKSGLGTPDEALIASAPLEDEERTRTLGSSSMLHFGTVPYMAPEVLSGQRATRASDIYSLGILIYELLVGRPPFQGSLAEIVAGHCSEVPPPPSQLNSDLPAELDDALLSALERIPSRRPERAADIIQRMRSAVVRAQARAWRAREVPRRLVLVAAAAVILPLGLAPVWRLSVLQQIENRSIDARFLATPKRPPDPRLILVSLDEASLDADPTPLPEKADDFGRELERVFDAGAHAVAIDFLLPEAWSRSRAFSDLILRHADALTIAAFSSPSGEVIGSECLNALTAAALGPERASDLFAFVNLDEDADGVNRRARLSYVDQGGRVRDALASRAVRSLENSFQDSHGSGLSRQNEAGFWIDYSADWRHFKRVSWKDLAATLELNPNMFRDQLVFVGGDFIGFGGDHHRVPSWADATSGVSGLVLQALIANTILSKFPVRSVQPFTFIYIAGIGVAVAGLMLSLLLSPRWLMPVLLAVTLTAMYVGASMVVFLRTQLLLPIVAPLLTTALAILLAVIFRRALPSFPEPSREGA
jgi:serine/threonine protein kinase